MYYYAVLAQRKEWDCPDKNMPSVKISASVLNSNLAELGKDGIQDLVNKHLGLE